ncbi:MAG: DUF924 domain-containing protein [Gammaproteobacteria bacterium]|nr:DUF924 domain-containing protein [Gammaproteobacteria bacterium]
MKNPARIEEVLKFWFDDLSPDDWFESDEAVDSHIRERFQELHEALREQVPEIWLSSARGCLAAVIVLDQFSRNMYRGTSRAFAADGAALSLAKEALMRGFDRELSIDERKFLYLPFEHSENPAEQARSMQLFSTLESELDLDYARRHKEIIDRFGRFPHRNAVLGRISTPEEIEFIKEPGSSF